MIVGIVGAEAAKFTPENEQYAKDLIRTILEQGAVHVVTSGHCHLGGIDIWAEEIAKELDKFDSKYIYAPKQLFWEQYKERNIKIVETCDWLENITVKKLPSSYKGMRFSSCYHCGNNTHVKSGGCWTAKYAEKIGKRAYWHIIGE